MDGVIVTSLAEIHTPKGNVFHALKKSDASFFGFGEAYFSTILQDKIKGWKKHINMTMNLVVISGEVDFVLYNQKNFKKVTLSNNNYKRLTVSPGIWMAFKGVSSQKNIVLNIANIEHNANESINKKLSEISYEW